MSHTADGFASPNELAVHYQRALNEKFPPPAIARRLRDVPADRRIAVEAWIEWERDGGQWVPGIAMRWDRHHVRVDLPGDRRAQVGGFWLSPTDVRRCPQT